MSLDGFNACVRFGFGARGNELQDIGADPKGWLLNQLQPGPPVPPLVAKRARAGGVVGQSVKEIRQAEVSVGKRSIRLTRHIFQEETCNRLLNHIQTDSPFYERLVVFWSNHFSVSASKSQLGGLVNEYEVQAIRPHVNGYFKDMLKAVMKHPAMLIYLDNVRSMGPNSPQGKRREKGLNENLAREILELHTLGVNGGYSQKDVISLAGVITGWGLKNSPNGPLIQFAFNQAVHEPGSKNLLGYSIKEEGLAEGENALTLLAEHPSTAKHIAIKLARHFISDQPPKEAVDVLAQSFMRSGGHLPTVMQTLIDLKQTWEQPLSKLKTPYEYVVSVIRASQLELNKQQLMGSLRQVNFEVFNAPSPAGFDDVSQAWSGPDSIMKRIEWAYHLAKKVSTERHPVQMAERLLGSGLSAQTRQTIVRAPSAVDSIALMFASPEFQRR